MIVYIKNRFYIIAKFFILKYLINVVAGKYKNKFMIDIDIVLKIEKNKNKLFGDPYGNRTHDSALRGLRLNRLTKGPYKYYYNNIP